MMPGQEVILARLSIYLRLFSVFSRVIPGWMVRRGAVTLGGLVTGGVTRIGLQRGHWPRVPAGQGRSSTIRLQLGHLPMVPVGQGRGSTIILTQWGGVPLVPLGHLGPLSGVTGGVTGGVMEPGFLVQLGHLPVMPLGQRQFGHLPAEPEGHTGSTGAVMHVFPLRIFPGGQKPGSTLILVQ
ncbi:MAG: hypothetical protein A2286_02870 [Gammaproteobacteria bacterium RIFOXYA12_FULL_61_12]|nr:MAG: hypothetical protein A2286_02870 [Gammaproteobacteria bacterium RIFOXYA12_FULL_61_12]